MLSFPRHGTDQVKDAGPGHTQHVLRRLRRPTIGWRGFIFLPNVRAYREDRLDGTGISPIFPSGTGPTAVLGREMLATGLKAVITCVDPTQLPGAFAGRAFDAELRGELPTGVHPCGERGGFHTFVWDGPGFRSPMSIHIGPLVARRFRLLGRDRTRTSDRFGDRRWMRTASRWR